jgi:methyl-accepting chemotaxis protein
MIPIILLGIISFSYVSDILEKEIGKKFSQIAENTLNIIDSNINEKNKILLSWSDLNIMQQIMVDDADGNILKNLKEYKKNNNEILEIIVINANKKIISSTNQKLLTNIYNTKLTEKVLKGKNLVTDFYYDDLVNNYSIALTAPVFEAESKTIIGAIIIFFDGKFLYKISDSTKITELKQNESNYSIILNESYKILSAPKFYREQENFEVLKKLKDENVINKLKKIKNKYFDTSKYLYGFSSYTPFKNSKLEYTGKKWLMVNAVNHNIAYTQKRKFIKIFIIVTLTFVIIILCASLLVSKKFITPIKAIVEVADKIEKGDYSERIKNNCNDDDEIGILSSKFNSMINQIQNTINAIANVVEKASKGDLTEILDETGEGELKNLSSYINKMILSLKELIKQVKSTVNELTNSTAEMRVCFAQMNAGSEQQTDSVNNICAAIAELSQSIQHVAENTKASVDITLKAKKNAEEGGKVVTKTISGMNKIKDAVGAISLKIQELSDSSEQIYKIVNVIQGISDKTSLLALNAAIEAARAGEQGKGFAVVADEVSQLAKSVASAATEIEELIDTSKKQTTLAIQAMEKGQEEVKTGVKLSLDTENCLKNIISDVEEIVNIMADISTNINEQSVSSAEVSNTMEKISELNVEFETTISNTVDQTKKVADIVNVLEKESNKFII